MNVKVLHVVVGAPMEDTLERARTTMEALQRGESPEPYFCVGFEALSQMLAVFTPKRLELIAFLREHGPLSVSALARAVGRNYKNVHGDVAALIDWEAIARDDSGRVSVPWDEIDVRLPLRRAA